tara:strand:- start:249563 stop:249742 length:180 start_codon:yes stop_codon:yes gene_type:complete
MGDGGHSSSRAVAGHDHQRPYPEASGGYPTCRIKTSATPLYLALRRVGFTMPVMSPPPR